MESPGCPVPPTCRFTRLRGLKCAKPSLDHTVHIPAEAVDDQFIQNLGTLIRRLAAEQQAARVPSAQECRFCDITSADCPERLDEGYEPQGGATSDF